jgi:hypothetical protein
MNGRVESDEMKSQTSPSRWVSTTIGTAIAGILFSLVLGMAGGGICGAAILIFGAFIGRSGTTGTEYFGYWNPAVIPIGLFYGGLFGAFVGPLAYPFLVRQIGFKKSILPAFLGTIIGGFAGSVAGPPFAVLAGICGFFLALFWTRVRLVMPRVSASQ